MPTCLIAKLLIQKENLCYLNIKWVTYFYDILMPCKINFCTSGMGTTWKTVRTVIISGNKRGVKVETLKTEIHRSLTTSWVMVVYQLTYSRALICTEHNGKHFTLWEYYYCLHFTELSTFYGQKMRPGV